MNESAETPSALYPVEYGTRMPGDLRTFRDGTLGNRRHSVPYGQSQSPFDNGVFGPALGGNAAETPQPLLTSYRDGLFNQGDPSSMPGPLTAYHAGLFSSPLGQVAGPLDFADPEVVLEWTMMMQEYWKTAPPTIATYTWDAAISDQVLAAAEALLANAPAGSNVTVDDFVHFGSDGLYYPKAVLLMMSFGSAYHQECSDGRDCQFPTLRDYYSGCKLKFDAIQNAHDPSNSDLSGPIRAANAACPIVYPAPAATEPKTASMAGGSRGLIIGGALVVLLLLGGGAFVLSRGK